MAIKLLLFKRLKGAFPKQDPGQRESKEGPEDVKQHDAVLCRHLDFENVLITTFQYCIVYGGDICGLRYRFKGDVQEQKSLTFSRTWRSHSFRTNPDTSSRPMRTRWTGLVFPSTAPIEMRAEAVHISATTKLHQNIDL